MADIKQARRRFSLVSIALLLLCLAAAGVLVSPIGNASRSGQAQIQQLWAELRAKDRDITPLRGIDTKVVEAKKQIDGFYDRLPSSYATISEQLGKVAIENGVKLTTGHYQTDPAEVSGVQRVRIQAAISGDYLQTVKFINALERNRILFLIDSVALGEQQGVGAVHLDIRMETYLKGAV